jgi:hypothetical protein
MYEQAGHLVGIMKDKTIPPRDNRARDAAMAETVACNEEGRRLRENPEEYKVKDVYIVA